MCFSDCFNILSILFPQLSTLFPEKYEYDLEQMWKNMEEAWIPWFPECGKIIEKIWNKLGKQYGMHIEKYGIHTIVTIENRIKYQQSLPLGQATEHLQMP